MNCKHCNAELEEGVVLCPSCGMAQEEPETVVEDVPAVEEAPVMEEAPVAEAPAVEEAPAKTGLGAGKIALLVVLAIAAIAVVIALVLGGKEGKEPAETTAPAASGAPSETVPMTIPADGNPNDATCKGTYTVSDDEGVAAADTVIATVGDRTLTVDQLQAYYWAEVGTYYSQYGEQAIYFGLDFSQPLDTQTCPLVEDQTLTWQQFFVQCALDNWHCYTAMDLEAEAEGYVPEEAFLEYVAALPQTFEDAAVANGMASSDEYVKTVAGAGCSVEDYLKYVEVYNETYLYYSDTCAEIAVTADEVKAHYAENQAE